MNDEAKEFLEELGIDPDEFYSNFQLIEIVDKMPDLPQIGEFLIESEKQKEKIMLDFLCQPDWIDANCKPVKEISLI